jgi:hypothetical protein
MTSVSANTLAAGDTMHILIAAAMTFFFTLHPSFVLTF